jgi:hypothetical protein
MMTDTIVKMVPACSCWEEERTPWVFEVACWIRDRGVLLVRVALSTFPEFKF